MKKNRYRRGTVLKMPFEVKLCILWQIAVGSVILLTGKWQFQLIEIVQHPHFKIPRGWLMPLQLVCAAPYLAHAVLILIRQPAYWLSRFLIPWSTGWGIVLILLLWIFGSKWMSFWLHSFFFWPLLVFLPMIVVVSTLCGLGPFRFIRIRPEMIGDCLWNWERDLADDEERRDIAKEVTRQQVR